MIIYLQRSASIQVRTSLGKSDVSWRWIRRRNSFAELRVCVKACRPALSGSTPRRKSTYSLLWNREIWLALTWLPIFEIFKIKMQNTPKILKYQNTPKILKFIKILRIFKIFQILVRRFRAISGVLRRFLRSFPLELEKC